MSSAAAPGTTAARPAVELRLPGPWRALPLGSDEEIAGEIAAFVREHFGRRDDQATLRAQQRSRLVEAARRARDAGAVQFHLSLRGADGLALASTVAEYQPRLPLATVGAPDPAAPALVADALVRVLAREAADGGHWDAFAASGGSVFERGEGLVLRTWRRREAAGDESPPTLVVDYWLTRPGRAEVVLVTFTTALAELDSVVAELFDAVIGASDWTPAAGEGAAPGGLRAELQTAAGGAAESDEQA